MADFFFEDPNASFEGICVYLDGMSNGLHGNDETRRRDWQLREELRSRFYEVIEIPFGNLSDREAMQRHSFRLGRILLGREGANRVRWRGLVRYSGRPAGIGPERARRMSGVHGTAVGRLATFDGGSENGRRSSPDRRGLGCSGR